MMDGPRLHWFWRTAIAAVVGGLMGMGLGLVVVRFLMPLVPKAVEVVLAVSWFSLGSAAAIGCYVYLTWRFGPPLPDNETRCRKCGYILRGISEPRCSECGERI